MAKEAAYQLVFPGPMSQVDRRSGMAELMSRETQPRSIKDAFGDLPGKGLRVFGSAVFTGEEMIAWRATEQRRPEFCEVVVDQSGRAGIQLKFQWHPVLHLVFRKDQPELPVRTRGADQVLAQSHAREVADPHWGEDQDTDCNRDPSQDCSPHWRVVMPARRISYQLIRKAQHRAPDVVGEDMADYGAVLLGQSRLAMLLQVGPNLVEALESSFIQVAKRTCQRQRLPGEVDGVAGRGLAVLLPIGIECMPTLNPNLQSSEYMQVDQHVR